MATIITGCSSSVPLSMAPASNGNVYAVNGQQRGFVIVGGTTAYPVGVTAAPSFTAATTNSPQYYFVSSVSVVEGGENYNTPPSVSIPGVTGQKAELLGDQVASIRFTSSAKTFTSAPAVSISGGQATNASASALLRGSVSAVRVNPYYAYYTSPPDVTFSAAANVTAVRPATGRAVLNFASPAATSAKLASVVITDPGVYEWTGSSLSSGARPVAVTVSAGLTGTGTPSLTAEATASVVAITATTGGSEYSRAPNVVVKPSGALRRGSGVVAFASLDGTTSVSSFDVAGGGIGFDGRATVSLESDKATAVAVVQPRISGKFLLGIRFVASDGTPGDLCELVEVDCGEKASSLLWNIGSITVSDSSPNRVSRLELWRTTSDQAITLYRVASLTQAQVSDLAGGLFVDELTDAELSDEDRDTSYASGATSGIESKYGELPILLPNGQPNAFRFGVPPQSMSVVTLFAGRAWYAVDSAATEPNAIYFSGIDELDSVPAENQIIIQNVGREPDAITGLMPMDGSLYVGQRQNLIRLTVGDDPLTSATAVPAAQRGMLNDRCWDQFEGVAYIADALGVYAFSGSSAEPISDPVATFWSDPLIDLERTKTFGFLRVNQSEKVVRFYYIQQGWTGSEVHPRFALCFSLVTKSWWQEKYGVVVSCGVRSLASGRPQELVGGSGKLLRSGSGNNDLGGAIPYSIRTGNFPLNKDPKRGVRLTYTPTASSNNLGVRLYYNNSDTPRANAIASDRGTGFTTTTGSTEAVLDMSASRSALGTASGFAQVSFAGRISDESSGADRSLSIELAGESSDSQAVIHRIEVEGAG